MIGLEKSSRFSRRVDHVSPTEWDKLLWRFEDASIYQSWAYGAVHWGEAQLSHLVLENDSGVVAAAQVRVLTVPIIRRGVAYIRWGPVCRLRGQPLDPEVLRQMTRALRKEYVEKRHLLLRMVPAVYDDDTFANAWKMLWSSLGLIESTAAPRFRTMRVDLTCPLETLRGNLHQRWRNYLRSAEKAGFTVKGGSTVEFYDQFLGAYREMMARKRFETTVDVALFRQMQVALPEALRMKVFLCQKDGQLFNALVVAAAGDTGIYLLAATSTKGLEAKGAHLLQWRAMEWLKSQGYSWYELGGINPDRNPGVFQFKNGLGGREVRQLAAFEWRGSPLSTVCVSSGERLKSAIRDLRGWLKKRYSHLPTASLQPRSD
jgi:lipid II:glycine glycyltransferase (peptidoglycan interpeptide bridge formation enzyme)